MKILLSFVSVLSAFLHGASAQEVLFHKDRFFASEFSGKARITIEREGPTGSALAVRVTTADVSAVAGTDYEPFDALVTLPVGATSVEFEITLPDDPVPEPDKTFRLAISGLPPGATSARPQATVVIQDNERPGSIDRAWTSTLGLTKEELERAQPMSVIPIPGGKHIVAVAIYDSDFMNLESTRLLRLNPDASIDPEFPARDIEASAAGNRVTWSYFMPMPDGGLLITRDEDTGGRWVYSSVHSRLRADGSIDESFPKITNHHEGGGINSMVQPDGKLLVYCSTGALVEGMIEPLFVRYHPDNSVDDSFAPVSDIIGKLDFRYRLLADGSLLLGAWSGVGGTYQLRRLSANGAPDPSFQPPPNLVTSGTAPNLHPLANGQIFDCTYPTLRRLRHDGSIDPLFTGSTSGRPNWPGSAVEQAFELAGGNLFLVGRFTRYKGATVNGIVRILPDGAIDPEFHSGQGFDLSSDPALPFPTLHALADGRFLADGAFDRYDGQPVTPPILLNPDGTRDTSFESTGEVEWVWGVAPVYFVAVAGDQIIVWTAEGLSRLVPPRPPVPAEPARLVSVERAGDAVRLTVAVQAGRRYTLETSPDLAQWTSAGSQTAASSQLEFTDTALAGTMQRFYRIAGR